VVVVDITQVVALMLDDNTVVIAVLVENIRELVAVVA
jgi:hypothetical protein